MTKLQKLLAATSIVGAALVMSSPANALYTVSSGTRFVAGGTTPTTLTATGNSIVINATDVAGVTTGEFSQAFNDGSFITITLSGTTKFAATPTIALNGGPAPTVTGGAGSQTLTITFAGGSTGVVNSVTITNITLNTLADTTTDITATLSGTAFAGSAYLTQNLVRFSAPISFAAKASNVTVSGTTATSFRDNKGSLGNLVATITATRAYDGVTAVTFGAPTAKAQISSLTAGSFSNVTFTELSGASTPCLPASTAVTANLIAATDIVDSATGTAGFTGCNVGVTLTPSGVTAIATGAVTLDVTVPVNNFPGTTSIATGLTAIGSIGNTTSAAITVPLSYNFGADAAYGYYVSVTAPSSTSVDPTAVSFRSGPYTTTSSFAGQIAPGTTKLFSIETIRAGLIAGGAPSSLFNGSSARAPLSVTAPAGAVVTALIQNKGQNIVTEVGKNLGAASAAYNQ
jgi:hypothetical protein